MFKHYFKIAWRNLGRQKITAFINAAGLSAGIACFILLLLYCVNEMSFDRFHKNNSSIYCVYEIEKGRDGATHYSASVALPLGPAIKKDIPDVAEYVRIKQPFEENIIRFDKELNRVRLFYADPQFFSVFSFPLKYGNASTALSNLNSLVLTSSKAKELFGSDQIIGKTVQVKIDDNFQPFTISAIAMDIPANSSIHFEAMGSFSFLEKTRIGTMFNNWYATAFRTYVQLRSGSKLPLDAQRLSNFHETYNKTEDGDNPGIKPVFTYGLLPLRSIHTDSRLNEVADVESIDPATIWIILGIAGAVLLIACINFTTLSIGHTSGRGREVGVRKVLGAGRKQLVVQFLLEAFLLSAFSTIAGLLLVKAVLPFFNELSGRDLQFSLALYPELGWMLAAIIFLVAVLSGGYPAALLSGFKPVEVLKNKMRVGGSNLFTRSLVTLQFTLSIGLILSTIIILKQTRYLKDKNPGFNKENVIVVDATQAEGLKNFPSFKQALATQTGILGIASAETGLGEGSSFMGHGFMYNNIHKTISEYLIDPDYINVLGMQLAAGRNFNYSIAADTTVSVIINEAMMNDFGWTLSTAIGQPIKGYTNSKTPVVIGVVKNFNYRSFAEKIQPQLFHRFPRHSPQKFFVRIKPGDPGPVLTVLQKVWNNLIPDVPFKYSFLDDDLNRFYRSEQRWSNIVGWAGGISIFLACMGLFGLTVLATINRTKEIGIRKVMGASVYSIVQLLSIDFVKLILLALLVASPLAGWFMHRWLEGFAYRTSIGWISFVATGCIAICLALTTIGIQALKAGRANPVRSLRSE